MGLGGISIWQLLIVLVIIVLLFGTKKLRNVGGDLGGAIKNFRKSMKDGEAEIAEKDKDAAKDDGAKAQLSQDGSGKVIEGEVSSKESSKST